MPLYRVFISSPSDLVKERRKLKKAIEKIFMPGIEYKCIMWEEDLPTMLTKDGQAEINNHFLNEADIIVALFKGRYGNGTERYDSGTVEEIEEAIAMHKPVLLYFLDFKISANNANQDTLLNLLKIINFKDKYRSRGIYHECSSIDKVIERISRDLYANINRLNQNAYSQFIDILTDELKKIHPNINRFESVILTMPDSKCTWNDVQNDSFHHFLNDRKEQINQETDDILSIIVGNDKRRFLDRIERSLYCIYTYRDFEYLIKIFKWITKLENDEHVYDKMTELLKSLLNNPYIKCFCQNIRINSFLASMRPSEEIGESIKFNLECVSICFYKLIGSIILISMGISLPDNFELKPGIADITDDFMQILIKIKAEIRKAVSPDAIISQYELLYDSINGKSDEVINSISKDFYLDFFKFVNSINIQDHILFAYSEESVEYNKIFKLYDLFYQNFKYNLYRNYNSISDNNGLMRYDLIDRKLVLEYLSSNAKEYKFKRIKPDGKIGSFVIRQAKCNDIENINHLNSPTPPYRRAIYVKSDRKEIEIAVGRNEVWVIEEVLASKNASMEIRNLACVAVILYNDSNTDNQEFVSDSLNKEYEVRYYKSVNRNFSYLDFDSVLTNDGRSGVGKKSYRGFGFQRLMLILAEELAKNRNCDYICATVSSFNKPSKRNFILNGYNIEDQKKYTLEENETSPFYEYIESDKASLEEKALYSLRLREELVEYKHTTLDPLDITVEAYKQDRDVPRDFVVLKLKNEPMKKSL